MSESKTPSGTQTGETSNRARGPRGFVQRLFAMRFSDLVLLIIMCVVVGMVLAFLNVDPARLWVDFFGAIGEAWTSFFDNLWGALGWMIQYFFLGAVIIVPLFLIWRLIKALSKT